MTEPEEIDEDLFADLYEGDEPTKTTESINPLPEKYAEPAAPPIADPQPFNESVMPDAPPDTGPPPDEEVIRSHLPENDGYTGHGWNDNASPSRRDSIADNDSHGIGIKEDGKMFIGGLNWETTDQSLKDYFSQFGEVQECTVMRDAATGRSRGFGFLTFRDPKTVNIVMVKEHFLDGKIIDPKRAIPRDEQEKTSKIFVGGVSQEATEQDFKEYFMQYGRVIDATLMMDKDTGRPRGFGFVTFDSEAAVEATLEGDLRIHGKPIEVKKAQPRGDMRMEDDRGGRGGRRGGRDGRYGDDSQSAHQNPNPNQQPMMNGMSPTMMVQYFQKMQQFMAMMAAAQGGGMANPMAMGGMAGMNPAMMQQMKMAQMQAMQQQMQQMQGGRQGDNQQGMQGMTPQMMQQMMQMQGSEGQGNFGNQMGSVPTGPGGGGGGGSGGGGSSSGGEGGGRRGTPSYNAQEQLAFEQQKYEQQQRRAQGMGNYQQGGPTSWEGMYDDVPQPNAGGHGGGGGRGRGYGRGGGGGHKEPPRGPSAPANAPTGPKNAGIPGANYRGGRGGGGHRANYHPYRR